MAHTSIEAVEAECSMFLYGTVKTWNLMNVLGPCINAPKTKVNLNWKFLSGSLGNTCKTCISNHLLEKAISSLNSFVTVNTTDI